VTWRIADVDDRRSEIEARFGASARAYAVSPGHRGGYDLDRMVELAELRGDERVLDIATGAGHTAIAFAKNIPTGNVIAYDMADGMLAMARTLASEAGLGNVTTQQGSAELLPFDEASFDVVTCRIAPHHFTDIAAATHEVARVLKPGGIYLVEDSLAPDDPHEAEWVHEAESVRDPTHVRSLTRDGWIHMCEGAGLRVEQDEIIAKRHDFAAWVDRGGCDEEGKRHVWHMFSDPPAHGRRFVEFDAEGSVAAFLDAKILIRARR
jgi:SAM-dependent methyltransferase